MNHCWHPGVHGYSCKTCPALHQQRKSISAGVIGFSCYRNACNGKNKNVNVAKHEKRAAELPGVPVLSCLFFLRLRL